MFQVAATLFCLAVITCQGRVPFPCDDVAIVGAGPAGTYAAYRLRNEGLQVTVYEYSDRVGGRLYTRHLYGAPDVNAELGGMRFSPQYHPQLDKVIKELRLPTKEFVEGFGYPERTRYFLRNVSLRYEDITSDLLPYNLTEEEKKNADDLFSYFFEKLIGKNITITNDNILSLKTQDGQKYIYELSALEGMRMAGASDEAIALMTDLDGFDSTFIEENSLAMVVQDYYLLPSDNLKTLVNGMSHLPKTLLQQFQRASERHQVQFNRNLIGIESPTYGTYYLNWEVTVSNNGNTHSTGTMVTTCAGNVILAVPVGSLYRINWQPLQIDPDIKENLEAVLEIPAAKMFAVYLEPWWLQAPRNSTVLKTDLSVSQAYHFGQSSTGASVLLTTYSDAETVSFWRRLQKQGTPISRSNRGPDVVTSAMIDQAHKDLSRAFGVPQERIPAPLSAWARFWDAYPFGLGWTVWRPGYHWGNVQEDLKHPVAGENVFIVGSDIAFGHDTQWIEGALLTVNSVIENRLFTKHS